MIEVKKFSFNHDWTTFPIVKFDETKTSFTVSYRGSQDWFLVVTHGLGSQTLHVPFAEVVKLLNNPDVRILEINNFNRSDEFIKELSRLFESINKHKKKR